MERLIAREQERSSLLDRIAGAVFTGGIVIIPTDTVYGIACDPMQPPAIAKIYRLKARDARKPLSLHVASVEEALEYAGGDPVAAAAIRRLLPGPVTLIVRRPAFIDEQMTSGLATMGLRVPDHALCAQILERCGPLCATSANFSGEPAFAGGPARGRLPDADLLIDDGPTPRALESTVVDLTAGRPRLIREGAIPKIMLEHVLGPIEGVPTP